MPSEFRSAEFPPHHQVPGLPFTISPITTDSNATAHPVEAITLSTIHAMLARVLEQTYTLWQAQASTSYTIHELRQTISVLQENMNIHERLRRNEDMIETYQDSSLPHSVPKPSPHNVSEIHDHVPLVNPRPVPSPMMSTQETPYHVDLISQGPSLRIQNSEDVEKEVSVAICALGTINQSSSSSDCISPGKIKPPESQHDGMLTFMSLPSMIKEHRDQSLDVSGRHTSLTSHTHVPSVRIDVASEDTSRAEKELLGTENESLIPSPSNDSTAGSDQKAAQDPASKNVYDPQEIIANDHQPFNTEREHGDALTRQEKRIISLEEGFSRLWHRFDDKQQLPFVQESVPRAADETLHHQLTDLTNLVRQAFTICGEKKVLMEEQWTERLRWKEESTRLIRELMGMTSWLVDDRTAARRLEDHPRKEKEENNRLMLEELQRQTTEQRGLLSELSGPWRADDDRRHEEIINAVRATANEQVPYNIQGYLDEFSKSLSIEVRMLLGEVGKLREERRHIQYEIGYLMTVQATLGPVGQFDGPPGYSSPHEWPSPAGIPLPESPQPHSGWRSIPVSARRRRVPRPDSLSGPERQVHSWTTWQPNPAMAPTPPSVEPILLVPDRGSPGLFGPRSPSHSYRDLHGEGGNSDAPNSHFFPQWAEWQPNPAMAPTPPSVEPTLLVLERGSSGLFGPRSPSDSHRDLHWGSSDAPNSHFVPGWVEWQPNMAPTPPSAEHTLLVPDHGSPSLFGPRSPSGYHRDLHREGGSSDAPNSHFVPAWVEWQPSPPLDSFEPTLSVPDLGSRELFGPPTPRDSYNS